MGSRMSLTVSLFSRLSRAGTILGQGGARPRAPKSGTRNKALRWNWSVFFVPKRSVLKKKVFAGFGEFFCPKKSKRSPKKKVFAGLGAFFVPKMAQDTSLGAAAPLLPAPMSRLHVDWHISYQFKLEMLRTLKQLSAYFAVFANRTAPQNFFKNSAVPAPHCKYP